jgi:hypothetical protein
MVELHHGAVEWADVALQAERGQHDLPVLPHKDAPGSQAAVYDAPVMHGSKGVRHLRHDLHRAGRRDSTLAGEH